MNAPSSGATNVPSSGAGRGATAWLALLLIGLSAVLAAFLEALLVPLYAGSTALPVAVVLALASNIGLPLLARTVVPTLVGVGLPFLAWLLTLVVFGVIARPEGDVILPGGSAQWVSYGVMLGGALAGTATVVSIVPPRVLPPAEPAKASASRAGGAKRR